MQIGTRSLVYGAHCVIVHPWFVALAWTRLYGFPRDPRLWLAFIVHDWGYWGSPNMDGPEGERHVELGARIMGVFGPSWARFARYHSRYAAVRDGMPVSRLCIADKLAIVLTPAWLYLPLARASGEIAEYKALAHARSAAGEGKYARMQVYDESDREWYRGVQDYVRRWVIVHADGRPDTWTPPPAGGA